MQMIRYFFSDCPKDLQLQLDIFCDYCRQFKLKVNISKTKCMTFSKGRNSNNQIFKFDGEKYRKCKSI